MQSYSQKLFAEALEKITLLYSKGDHPSIIAAKLNMSDMIVNAIIERYINDKK
jgi:hypothetical protein